MAREMSNNENAATPAPEAETVRRSHAEQIAAGESYQSAGQTPDLAAPKQGSEPGSRWLVPESQSGEQQETRSRKRRRRAAARILEARLGQNLANLSPVAYSRDPNFINRELSWLQFNGRVLDEARDRSNPLMERLSFLSITQSNLDEFFMVRVASLKDMVQAGYTKPDIAGLTASEQLVAISEQTHLLYGRMYSTWGRSLEPRLAREGVHILKGDQLSPAQREEAAWYFRTHVYPILTPMAVDSGRPFPLISNGSLNICVLLADSPGAEPRFATVQVPGVLPRFHVLGSAPAAPGKKEPVVSGILLEELVKLFIAEVFENSAVEALATYRISRNADLDIDEEDAEDLLIEIEKQIRLREWGEVIRLEADADIDPRLLGFLVPSLGVASDDIYLINGPLDLTFLSGIRSLPQAKRQAAWYYPPYDPQPVSIYHERRQKLIDAGAEEPDFFSVIASGDVFCHHPFESFDTVLDYVRAAAEDPDVLAIKQTLYRVSGESPIIRYLEQAARNGKQVMVLVELKARFDEANNIVWARRLERAGCHVIYGLMGLKVHSKITLVVRRESDGIRRYLHLGTGNYNDQTAKVYTDMGILMCRESFGSDATEFFNMLSGYAEPDTWNRLIVAPYWLRNSFVDLIEREVRHAKAGLPAAIRAKMNSLVDQGIIEELYRASQAGVKIELVVRGICCLRPGVPGLSDNIHVRSLVGRYLEHSRIFVFANNGHPETYLSSADWMPRNLDRRVELLFPVVDPLCIERVNEVLDLELIDTQRAHIGQPDGGYIKRPRRGRNAVDSQVALCELALERAPQNRQNGASRLFEPINDWTQVEADAYRLTVDD